MNFLEIRLPCERKKIIIKYGKNSEFAEFSDRNQMPDILVSYRSLELGGIYDESIS